LDLYFKGQKIATLIAANTVLIEGGGLDVRRRAASVGKVLSRIGSVVDVVLSEYRSRVVAPVMKQYSDAKVGLDLTEIDNYKKTLEQVVKLIQDSEAKYLDVLQGNIRTGSIFGVSWGTAGQSDLAAVNAGANTVSQVSTAIRETVFAVCKKLKEVGYHVFIDNNEYTSATQLGLNLTQLDRQYGRATSSSNIEVMHPKYGNTRIAILPVGGDVIVARTGPGGVRAPEYKNMIARVLSILNKASACFNNSTEAISTLIKPASPAGKQQETIKKDNKGTLGKAKFEDIASIKEAVNVFSQTKNDNIFIDVNLGVCSSFDIFYTALEAGVSFFPAKEIVVRDITTVDNGVAKKAIKHKFGEARIVYPSEVAENPAHKITFKEKVSGHITPIVGLTNGSFIIYAACKLKYSKYEFNFEPSVDGAVSPSNAVVTVLSPESGKTTKDAEANKAKDSGKSKKVYTDLVLKSESGSLSGDASLQQKSKKNACHVEVGGGIDCRVSKNVIVGLGYWFSPKKEIECKTGPYATKLVHDAWQTGTKHNIEAKSHKIFLKVKVLMPL
jgi:opacity protein-like surface antigen